MKSLKICSRCAMDETVPDIVFDNKGECNYCKQWDALDRDNPNDERGQLILDNLINKIKKTSGNKKYNVIVGVSGGTDSSYLLHLAKESGLKPLAVHFDNGWNSEISVTNLHNVLEALEIDLFTYVVNYDEMKDILLSAMKAAIPWIDGPTDNGLVSTLYKAAAKENIDYIFVGNNFRTEGKQPELWTACDGKQIDYIIKKFGTRKIKTYPYFRMLDIVYYTLYRKIKLFRPFYYIKYNKNETKLMLKEKYNWRDYSGHHHENIFTRFAIAYWLPRKHNIDKRKVTFSALIRSGEMDRNTALELLTQPPYDSETMELDKEYVIKKLNISNSEFDRIWNLPNKYYFDYPTYRNLISRNPKLFKFFITKILPFKPMMMYELEKEK